jgi:hypothetical protein
MGWHFDAGEALEEMIDPNKESTDIAPYWSSS